MRQPLLVFELVSTVSAIVFEAIDFPLGAMIVPIFAVGNLTSRENHLTRVLVRHISQ